MAIISLAYTAPINPPNNSSSTLTSSQVWAGLSLKVRAAQDFVPVFSSTRVLSTTTDPATKIAIITREVTVKPGIALPGATPDGTLTETCYLYAPSRVDFVRVGDGSSVSNIVSYGEDGGLYMTYAFQLRNDGIDEGDGEAIQREIETQRKLAVEAVAKSIVSLRRLAGEGRLGD